MAGPGASIPLAKALTDTQWQDLAHFLHRISDNVREVTDHPTISSHWYEFSIIDAIPIGRDYAGNGCPFDLSLVPADDRYAPDELDQFKKNFGFVPEQALEVSVMCNSTEYHRLLGWLILYLAERYNSLIDFGGALTPQSDWRFTNLGSEPEWSAVKQDVEAWLMAMPGKITAIEYETATDRVWAYHVADVEFFRNWLKHPEFQMIK